MVTQEDVITDAQLAAADALAGEIRAGIDEAITDEDPVAVYFGLWVYLTYALLTPATQPRIFSPISPLTKRS